MQWHTNAGNDVALPAFIDFTSSGISVQDITISPTTSEQIGSYTLKATFQPTHGSAITYAALVLTVTCTVTSFTRPAHPADLYYNVYAPTASVNVGALTYTMTPPCGYAFDSTFTWTGLTSFITQDASNSGRINVKTNDVDQIGMYGLEATNTITLYKPDGTTATFTLDSIYDVVQFDVFVQNACPRHLDPPEHLKLDI